MLEKSSPTLSRPKRAAAAAFADSPSAWFVELERAIRRGDLDGAVAARDHLRRLGVDVSFKRLNGQAWTSPRG